MPWRYGARHYRLAAFAATGFVLAVVLPSAWRMQPPVAPRSAMSLSAVLRTSQTITSPVGLYLPLVRSDPPVPAKLGVDFGFLMRYPDVLAYDLPLAREMGARWIRLWLAWRDVERVPGVYDWAEMDAQVERAREVGLEPLIVLYSAPSWASRLPCGPVDDLAAFEGFVRAAAERYRSVTAWEYTNEPDGRAPHPWGPVIGCWAPYPCEYADHLRRFHEAVKAANPSALVFHGGLAYDKWEMFDRQFFTHTLECGAGNWFDGLSLHCYPINLVEFPTMAQKIAEVQGTMERHGVFGRYIWITETAMWSNYGATLDMQKDFIVKDLTRGFCSGADNLFWYSVRQEPSDPVLWRWLIDREHRPAQGYYTYQHYARQIGGGHCLGQAWLGNPAIEVYRFRVAGSDTYVLWSNGPTAVARLPAPQGALVTDRDGESTREVLADKGGQVELEVSLLPLFVRPMTASARPGNAHPGPRSERSEDPKDPPRAIRLSQETQNPTAGTLRPWGFLPVAAAAEWLTAPALRDDFDAPEGLDLRTWRVFAGEPTVRDGWLAMASADVQSRESYRYGRLQTHVRSVDWLAPETPTASHMGLEVWTGINGTCHQAAYLEPNGRLVVLKGRLQPTGTCEGEADEVGQVLDGWAELQRHGLEGGDVDVELLWSPEWVSLSVTHGAARAATVYRGELVPDAPLRIRLLAEPGRGYRFDYVRFHALR